jgi:hypothetical protein
LTHHAKASSAGSTEGSGKGRSLSLMVVGVLILAITVALGAAIASAASPTVTLDTIDNATYTSVDLHGKIDPNGEPISWFPEMSTDGVNWGGAPGGGFIDGSQVSGPQEINETVGGLTAGQAYFFRLVGINNNDGEEVRSAELEITTKSIPAPTVTINPIAAHTGTTAQLSGHIDPNAPSGALSPEEEAAYGVAWHFECTPECPGLKGGTVEASAEGDDQIVEAQATGLEPNTPYTVTLVGKNAGPTESDGPVEFTTDAVEPEVQTLPAFAIRGGTEALVGGSINPHNSATTYWVEYGADGQPATKFPLTPVSAGSGGQLEYFTQRLTGLNPSTVYHVLLVAENSAGPSQGVEQNFETPPASDTIAQDCSNATLRIENNSTSLPECRAYEQVSPVDKNGFDLGLNPQDRERAGVASEDGSKFAFEETGTAFGDSRANFIANQFLSSRGPGGWTTHALSPPAHSAVALTILAWYSADLQHAVLRPPSGYALAPGDFAGDANLYAVNTTTDQATSLTVTDEPHGNTDGYTLLGSSQDGSIVYFGSTLRLVDNAPYQEASGEGGNGSNSVFSVYEWDEGNLRLASVYPNGEPLEGGGTISDSPSGHTFVSRNGSRMIFKGDGNLGFQLFIRENGETYEITPPGIAPSSLLGATSDLASVFFGSASALTPDAANDGTEKLYRYNAGPKTVTLISPKSPDGGSVGSVRGVSPDGEYVYFRSTSQYIPGQGLNGTNEPGADNLYMWHDGEVSFIAAERHPELDRGSFPSFRLSANGRLVSFQSTDRLTAYDNTDATPGPGGGSRADAEVYVYDAEAKRVTCVSCNPSGERPSGTAEGQDAGSAFPSAPEYQFLNPQRGVGDDGHIFFTSRDSLVPADVNGVEDVYEWRNGQPHLISTGTGSEPAFFSGASSSGDDVFFATRQRLVSSDRDGLGDYYDARVDGGFAHAAEASLCEGLDTCHGSESRPPAESTLGTPDTRPEGKANPTQQRLKKALRACKKKPKKKRPKCEAAAKKRFKSTGRAH